MKQDILEILITNEEIISKSKQYGEIISKDYKGEPLVLVGLLKGCLLFFAELSKHIDLPLEMDFMIVSSYENTNSTGIVNIKKDITLDIKGKNVLIVEDIIDTGQTLKLVMNHIKALGAKSVEVITLLDKKEGRVVKSINPKYNLFDIPNKFVVGFGLDYNEFYRNLPYVGVLDEKVYKK